MNCFPPLFLVPLNISHSSRHSKQSRLLSSINLKVDQVRREVFFTRGHAYILVLVRSNFPRAINIFESSFNVRSFRCALTWPRYGNSQVPALAAGVPAQCKDGKPVKWARGKETIGHPDAYKRVHDTDTDTAPLARSRVYTCAHAQTHAVVGSLSLSLSLSLLFFLLFHCIQLPAVRSTRSQNWHSVIRRRESYRGNITTENY